MFIIIKMNVYWCKKKLNMNNVVYKPMMFKILKTNKGHDLSSKF